MGLLPAAGGIRRLVAELGVPRTNELVLLGRTLDASAALQWGLATAVHDDPLSLAITLAESLASRDPLCIKLAKMLIRDQADTLRGRATEAAAQALLYGRRKWRTT